MTVRAHSRRSLWVIQAAQLIGALANATAISHLGRAAFGLDHADNQLLASYFDWATQVSYHASRYPASIVFVSLFFQWLQLRSLRESGSVYAVVPYWIVVNVLFQIWLIAAAFGAVCLLGGC